MRWKCGMESVHWQGEAYLMRNVCECMPVYQRAHSWRGTHFYNEQTLVYFLRHIRSSSWGHTKGSICSARSERMRNTCNWAFSANWL